MHESRTTRKRGLILRVALPLALAGGIVAALLPGSGAARAQAAPTNTTEPRIIGEAVEGKTLTANPGTWSGTTPIQYAYRWVRCPTDGGANDGANCGFIPNATNSSYRLRDADVGLRIRVRVTASNSDGAALAASNPTAIVRGSARPRNAEPPTIAGSPVVGQTLTASPGTWSGTQPITFSYQWRRCNASGGSCGSIGGATGRTYGLRQADVGSTLRVRVTARNSVGSADATSVPTAVIAATPVTGCPGGTGPVHVDQLTPPARLLVDRLQVTPSPIPRSATNLVVRFHVSACNGRDVAGALVYVTATPYNQFVIPPEQPTGADGWATLNMQRGRKFPAASNQTLLVMFVRARKGSDPLLGGISTRRLVSFRLAK
jgi:hypothetical protein